MTEPNLLVICVFAFIAVFTLLSVLAVLMHLLTRLFPPPPEDSDAPVLSAIMSAAAAAFPGMRVTHVEENR